MLANWLEVTRASGHDGYNELLQIRGLANRLRAAEERVYRRSGEKVRALHEALRVAQRRLAFLVRQQRVVGGPRSWQRLVWRREVAAARAHCADLNAQLLKRSRGASRQAKAKEATTRSLVARLRGGEALVDIVVAGGHYVAWVLAKGRSVQRVELGDTDTLEDLVADYHAAIANETTPTDELQVVGTALRKALWRPIVQALPQAVETLYIVPGGATSSIPLGALPGKDKGTVLAERLLLVNLTLPHALLNDALPGKPGKGYVVLGDVDFDKAERQGAPEVSVTGRRLLADLAGGFARVSPLPATADEMREVAAQLKRSRRVGGRGVELRGAGATEQQLREHAPGKAVLHLATHAAVRNGGHAFTRVPQGEVFRLQPGLELHAHRMDPLLMSGVMLAGINKRTQEGHDDGMLTGLEALHLDLDGVQLVVLSACQSARANTQDGQGQLGLVSALRLAGARHVIGSLWHVNDEATSALMQAFYARWTKDKKLTAAQALRGAMLDMRRGALGRVYPPSAWAAFVAYGPLR